VLCALLALVHAAAAGPKIPATANIGLGPTVAVVWAPSDPAPTPVSLGLSLAVEGWLSKKTLRSRAVMRRVPKAYKDTVRGMDDLHVVPLPAALLPDQLHGLPLNAEAAGAATRALGWTPITLYLHHDARPGHQILGVSPRLGWVRRAPVEPAADSVDHAFLGVDLSFDRQSPMAKPWGTSVGGQVSPGWLIADDGDRLRAGGAVWTSAWLRVQLRREIKVEP